MMMIRNFLGMLQVLLLCLAHVEDLEVIVVMTMMVKETLETAAAIIVTALLMGRMLKNIIGTILL